MLHVRPLVPLLRVSTAVVTVCLAAACSGGSPATLTRTARTSGAGTAGGTDATGTGRPGPAAPAVTPPSPSAPPPAAPKPRPRPAVSLTSVRTADGSVITVAVFRGPVTYVLHNGSSDPGWLAASKGVKAGSVIGRGERRRVLAAFNGGFKTDVGAGGYEQEGKVITPLLKGYASLIIDKSGRAHIADWGYGAPAAGEQVYSVRQNLAPLVYHGRPEATAADWWDWGATIGGAKYVARSAVGENAAGDLIYAGSMSAVPADLAAALVKAGARIGMELDINPEWVQLDVASRPGGPLRAAVPGQWRPADQYLAGWTRDFFTVLG